MHHSPLIQFAVKNLYGFNVFGWQLNITNSSLFMFGAVVLVITYFNLAFRKVELIPSRLQMSGEIIYNLIDNMLDKSVGTRGESFRPLIFSIFLFILSANLLGMLPFSFATTSHISITFALAATVFLIITIYGLVKHGFYFFKLFLPQGTPLWLAPLIILIELFTYLTRPISLSLRLAANMIAGHVLLEVLAGFMVSLILILKILPAPFIVILIGFEIFVAILQAYIFTILSCVYLNDAVNLH